MSKIRAKTTPKVLLIAMLMLTAFVGAQFVATVKAAGTTEYMGTVSGVNYVVRFPDPWNGMLVILTFPGGSAPVLDPRTSSYNATATTFLNKGYAVAASNYGGAYGYPFVKAVNSTYTITKYIVDTYSVTGKVFLYGVSQGGNFAVFLGEKYPELFDGVLDIGGSKDAKSHYAYFDALANLTIAEIRSFAPIPANWSDAMVQTVKNGMPGFLRVYQNETGGSPLQVPNAYEDRSNTYHANITVPVITIHSLGDVLVPYSQTTMYQAVVASLGRSALYRVYTYPAELSSSSQVPANEISARFDELVAWANQIGEYRGWKVVPSEGRIYVIPPQFATGVALPQQIGTWDAEYYGKLGKTIADAAKPCIDECIANYGSKYPTP